MRQTIEVCGLLSGVLAWDLAFWLFLLLGVQFVCSLLPFRVIRQSFCELFSSFKRRILNCFKLVKRIVQF